MNQYILKNEEKIIFELRTLYDGHGYSRYKMNKFEEYDLYVRNKDFLISDGVITFTDTNGKLMALKPDVTLSIVKNSRDIPGCVQRLYYDENVYRVSKGTHSFSEIMQMGLECIGEIDDYSILEVLNLAAASLEQISSRSILNLSHLGVLSELLADVSENTANEIYACLSGKNAHELACVCAAAGIDEHKAMILDKLLNTHGKPEDVLPGLEKLIGGNKALKQLEKLASALSGGPFKNMIRIDFSVVSDASYYNGVVFKGFVEGVPAAVLSGGQYDRLMRKMNRKSGAIGFAVYLDHLERLNDSEKKFDADVLLLYEDAEDLQSLYDAVDALRAGGKRVIVQHTRPEGLRCAQLARYRNGEVEILEEYA